MSHSIRRLLQYMPLWVCSGSSWSETHCADELRYSGTSHIASLSSGSRVRGKKGKAKNNSPGAALKKEYRNKLNGAVKSAPNMKSCTATSQSHKRLPSSRSGLTARSQSTPSLVEDQKNEQCSAKLAASRSSAGKIRLRSAQLHSQQTSGTSCRKKLMMGMPLKNYHSETSLNNLLSAPTSFSRECPQPSISRADADGTSCEETSKLMVGVRVRPLSDVEKSNPSVINIVTVQDNEIIVSCDQTRSKFAYDHCFWSCDSEHAQFATQEDVFVTLVRPLIDKVFEGYNACLFAYGQTGSGKSYSMMGENLDSLEFFSTEAGVIPRFCHELFHRIAQKDGDAEYKVDKNWKVEITYYEVYNEKIHDLLDECDAASKKCLRVREHPSLGPYVEDLAIKEVRSLSEVLGWLKMGNNQRVTASTEMNEKSSRSHSIFSLTLTQTQVELVMGESVINTRSSRCNLVDLAGSERIAQTCSSGERRKEGVSINQSLLTLGKVISALAEIGSSRKSFAPYRESVLTFLLKESLGGNSRTVMLATISPANTHVDETIATLRYACQARKIVNRVRVNEVPQISVIRTLTADVARLNAVKEQYEAHLRDCQEGSESRELREQLEKLRQEHGEHLRGCPASQDMCPRADCAEARRQWELQLAECRSRHDEELGHLKVELSELRQQSNSTLFAKQQPDVDKIEKKLSSLRKEYDTHLRSCQLGEGSELQALKEELKRVNLELSELRSCRSGLADEVQVLRIKCGDWQARYAKLEEEHENSRQKCKQQEKELHENKLQHLNENSQFGRDLDNFKIQLEKIQERIGDMRQFEGQPLPKCDFGNNIDLYRTNLLKKLTSALNYEMTSPSASEFSLPSDEAGQEHLLTEDNTCTVNEEDLFHTPLSSTYERLSSGMDDINEVSLDNTQSFVSQASSLSGTTEETIEEILYCLQDKSNRLKELCAGEDAGVAISAIDQAVSELKDVLQMPQEWDLSQHFSPPSPSVTPAKSSLRSPAAPRVPTPKSVKFQLDTDS